MPLRWTARRDAAEDFATAASCFRHIANIFEELNECRAFELLRSLWELGERARRFGRQAPKLALDPCRGTDSSLRSALAHTYCHYRNPHSDRSGTTCGSRPGRRHDATTQRQRDALLRTRCATAQHIHGQASPA